MIAEDILLQRWNRRHFDRRARMRSRSAAIALDARQ
jgi:hypothetical protein